MEMFPGLRAIIDATEQEIRRPKNSAKRKSHYTGKRRRHTVKTQLTVNSEGLIVHETKHARGRRHDYCDRDRQGARRESGKNHEDEIQGTAMEGVGDAEMVGLREEKREQGLHRNCPNKDSGGS